MIFAAGSKLKPYEIRCCWTLEGSSLLGHGWQNDELILNRRIFLFDWLRATKAKSTREPGVCVEFSFLQLRLPVEHHCDRIRQRIAALRIDQKALTVATGDVVRAARSYPFRHPRLEQGLGNTK